MSEPPLEDLRDVDTADVYKSGRLAGVLRREWTHVEFRYRPDYLAAGGAAVATSLPAHGEPVRTHAAGALPPFFSGLLPEGRRLGALRRAVKTSADDEFSLLLAVGADPAGDVQIVPEGEEPRAPPARLVGEAWSRVRFASLYSDATGTALPDRVGMAGVQEKVSAAMIALPVASARARYLLKLDPPEFPHLVANEAFFLHAARESGLDTAEASVMHDADGRPGLLVRRFDREVNDDGTIRPLALEDATQVLGRYPADKYNVTCEEACRALADVTRARPVAARDLFRQFAFAYLTCNGDVHAKNVSVRFAPSGEWRVSPAYDLPSSYPYGDDTMALSINGRRREDIGRGDFLALAAAIGLRERAACRVIDELVERMPRWTERLDELPFDERTIHKLGRAIRYRQQRLVGN